jgi:hypothetical protein
MKHAVFAKKGFIYPLRSIASALVMDIVCAQLPSSDFWSYMECFSHISSVQIIHDWISKCARRKFVFLTTRFGIKPGSIISGAVVFRGRVFVQLWIRFGSVANSENIINIDIGYKSVETVEPSKASF